MTRLCIVRHGETAWNAEHRVQGQLDVPLSAVGRAQARAVARALSGEKFCAIYSSDLSRALETARATSGPLGVEPLLDERLVGSSRVDLQACKLEYSIVSPK